MDGKNTQSVTTYQEAIQSGNGEMPQKALFIFREGRLESDSPYYPPSAQKPYNPDEIASKKPPFGIYDEMRRDDQVKAVLLMKKFMVLCSGWNIAIEDEQYEDAVDEINANFEHLDNPDFGDALMNMLSYLDYGFSITEPVFDVNQSGRIYLKSLKTRPPHSFELHTDNSGNVNKIIQHGMLGMKEVKRDGLIHMIHQPEFGIPYGISDLQAAYRPWFSKDMVIKFWNIHLERFGNPHIVATVPTSISNPDFDKLKDIIDKLQAKSGMIVPEGTDINIKGSPTGTTGFESAIDKHNMMIARSMLMPDLIGVGGATITGGSYALGKEHFEIFYMTIEKIRHDLERMINRMIVHPLLFWNWGIRDFEMIRWKINAHTIEDKLELLKLWVDAVTGKLWQPTEEEVNHFRRQVDFPEGEVVPVQEPQPLGGGGFPFRKSQSSKQYVKRAHTPYERKVDFDKLNSRHDDLEESAQKLLAPIYATIREGLAETVNSGNIVEGKKFDRISELKLKFLKNMELAWRVILKDTFKAGAESAKSEVAMARRTERMQIDPVTAVFEEAINERAFFITGVERDRILRDARLILLAAIDHGWTTKEAIKQLDDLFLENYDFGKGRLETIVRTNTNKAFNFGRRTMFEDPALEGFVKAYQFSAILDATTTEICTRLDGKIYRAGDPYIDKITPPLHFNALVSGTRIFTNKGSIPIECIEPGMKVLTHRNRWRPVYSTMMKLSDHPTVRALFLSTGRTLHVTDEHPILTACGWKSAGDLNIGDVLFEHSEKMGRTDQVLLSNPNDFPAPLHEKKVSWSVVRLASFGSVSFPINFNSDLPLRKGKVNNSFFNRILENERNIDYPKKPGYNGFSCRRVAAESFGQGNETFLSDPWHMHGISSFHSFGMARMNQTRLFTEAKSPMILSSRSNGRVAVCDRYLGGSGANGDTMPFTPVRQYSLSDTEGSFDESDRLSSIPMSNFDQLTNSISISKINHELFPWKRSTIVSIVDEKYNGFLWNLEVLEDETYLAENLIVHNCRSLLIPIVEGEQFTPSRQAVRDDDLESFRGIIT